MLQHGPLVDEELFYRLDLYDGCVTGFDEKNGVLHVYGVHRPAAMARRLERYGYVAFTLHRCSCGLPRRRGPLLPEGRRTYTAKCFPKGTFRRI